MYSKQSQLTKTKKKRLDEHIDEAKLAWIRKQPCYVCGKYGSEAHHITIKGMGGRNARNDMQVLPLCHKHHRGEFSPHGRDADLFYKEYPKYQLQLAAIKYQERYEDDNSN